MKILLGYSYYQYDVDIREINEAWLARLRAAGNQVDGVCLTLNPPGPCLLWKELDERWRKRDKELLKLYERIAEQAANYDVFINYNGINLHPEFVPQLPTFNVFSCADDPENSRNLSRPVAAAYDLCLVANIAALPLYRNWGVKEARFWPHGFRVTDYDPSLTKEDILSGERDVDITMLCERQSHWRKERLDRFTAALPDGAYYGPGWPKGFLPESQRIPLLQRVRVGLNMHNSTGPINFRTYYLPANGVLQVCDNKSHLGQIFELNQEVAGYDTIEEAIELCRYYLAHEDERRQVAAAGWERALRDYNEVAVFQLVERYVQEVKAARAAAPARLRPATVLSSKRKPTIFLHTDLIYEPDKWYQRFESLLKQQSDVNYRLVNLLEADLPKLLLEVQPGDALVGRFGHHPDDLRRIRPIYDQIARVFEGRIFPKLNTYRYYDDKAQQAELFRMKGYPAPATAFVSSPAELEKFVAESGVRFPLVTKQIHGAGSSTVKLATDPGQVPFPCLVQEFCAGNDGDYRINVIGDRVMGFRRLNRDNDFRASGSGKILYSSDFDAELVRLAYRISKENGFDSMAYDFVKKDGQWVVLEISYAYQDVAVRNCEFYYDMRTGGKVAKRGVYPQDFILADFLKEHYAIEARSPSNDAVAAAPPACTSKPRILLIADVPRWIFERHARALHRYLDDEFEFTLGYQNQTYNENDFDLIYPLEWNLIPPQQIRNPAKYVTAIRSHFTWADRPFMPFVNFLATSFQRVHVVSRRLHEIFRHALPSVTVLSHGIDTAFFTPTTRADLSGRKLRLGWAGNRKSPVKGFAKFIEPLGQLPGLELVICGYSDHNLSLEQMKDFYNSIDAYVCASDFEGNNNSLMEAAAMARAIITTDNGTVPEYLSDDASALIVARELPAFIRAVERLRDDPALRLALGEKARAAVLDKWDWRQRAEDYRTFFRAALRSRTERSLQPVAPSPCDHVAIATAYMERGDLASARRSLELAVDLAPNSPELLATLAKVYDQLGDAETSRRVREKLEKPIMATTSSPVSGYSFCIITHGKRPEKLQREIESIRALNVPRYEILVGGDVPAGLDQVTVVSLPDAAQAGRLGEMRNRLVERAQYDHVVVADDDLLFQPDFYQGLLKFGEEYDVQCVRFLNPDGTRFWDWATSGGPLGHVLLPYDQTDPHVYVTGGLCIMKKSVAGRMKWNEQLGFYQAEDSEFSRRLHEAGISIRFNPHSTVVHDDPRHTQLDNFVVAADPIRQMARDAFRQNHVDRARYLLERLQALCPGESIVPEQLELESWVDKREGRYAYLCDEILAGLAEADGVENAERLARVLGGIGPFYFHCGGAGDAWLLLSKFYGRKSGNVILSHPRSLPAVASFLESFPGLGTIYVLPAQTSNDVTARLQSIVSKLPNCRGAADKPGTHAESTQALEQDGNCVAALSSLAALHLEENHFDKAKGVLQRLSELQPQNEAARHALAAIDEAQTAASLPPIDDRLERISCPFCGSKSAEPYRTVADIVKCRRCHAVYLRTRPSAAELDRIYQTYVDEGSHLQLPTDAAQAAATPWKRSYFLNEILELNPTRGPLLDVGCSWGAFLLGSRERGFTPMGIEITRKAVRFANETLRIPVVNTQFLETPIPSAALQVLTMLHVLEHLPKPRQAIAKAFDILKPGGLFCGIVPNIESFSSQQQQDDWYWLDANYHYVHYSPATLRARLEAAGFVVERLYTTRGDFDAGRIRALVPHLDDGAFEEFLRELEGKGQGEEIRFFARKPAHVPATITDSFTLPLQRFPWPAALDPYICRHDGRYFYLSEAVLEAGRLQTALAGIEPFYFHCGGAGDALLLLATFLDAHPESVILSYPNSQAAMRSFFEAFPTLKKVYFLPPHSLLKTNELLRTTVPQLPNFLGMGTTPRRGYAEEWNEQIDIFRDYGVAARPQWARRGPEAAAGKRVTVSPQGSLVGMAGTKRNVIEPHDWAELLRFLQEKGYHPVILGTPDERETYPCPDGCEDRRSFSFREQMEHITSSALFVGADSWAKTFSALAGVPTIVFDAIKGRDWRGQKDPSDFTFLDPWDCLQVVSGLEHCKDVLVRNSVNHHGNAKSALIERRYDETLHVAWEGTFTDNGSLSQVNRELTRQLVRQSKVEVARVGDGQRAQSPTRTQVTVRHAWPPNWQRPKHGAWVLIQPWEFGALPLDWLARLAGVDEVWAPSEYVRRVYVDSGVTPSKVKVVPNGIDPARFRPEVPPMKLATSKSFKFLFVGGTIHRKGPDLLLKAYLGSFTAADDVCLVIKDFGGNSVYTGQTFEAQIRDAQAQPNAPEILHLTNELSSEQMPGLYTACDGFVLPYRGEGFALPVLEAMACGLPVIVTAGGATDDFATDELAYRISATPRRIGYNVGPLKLARPGWLLEPSLNELKERMQWVATHREEARAKGRAASEHARREWTWERAAQRAAQQLREVAVRQKDQPANKAKPFELPAVARIGHLGKARELFEKKKHREAWDAAVAALEVRPFHPEARELLKEISRKSPAMGPVPKPPQEPRLTVCLIAKNEEKFVARCLQSVRDIALQIVVVDTGSTDRTREIARECGAEVHEFKWCDDFSAARNAALEHARGDWVLVLDADEELTAEGREVLRQEMRADKVMGYRLPIVDVGQEDEGCGYVPRLFRNAPALFYIGRIHEQVFSSIEVRRQEWGMENKFSKATLLHHGYTAEMTQNRGKNTRNLRLLELAIEEIPNEPNLMMNYGLELVRAGQLGLGLEQYIAAFRVMQSQPAGQIVPELRESLLTQLCTHLMTARKFEEIVTVLNTPLAREHGGLTAALHFALGLALMEVKTYREAAEQFRQCLAKRDRPALTPMNRDIRKAGPHHCLAVCLMHLREFDAAAEAFQQALADDPQSRRVRFGLAAFLASRGLPVEALKQLHALVSEKADELPVWLLGGQIALSQPDFVEFACDWTGEATKLFPQDPQVRSQRAESLLLSGKTGEALRLWRDATEARNVAARLICEVVTGEAIEPLRDGEVAISREFLAWYRRLVRWGANATIFNLNENVHALRNTLPTAVATLEAAFSEARQVATV